MDSFKLYSEVVDEADDFGGRILKNREVQSSLSKILSGAEKSVIMNFGSLANMIGKAKVQACMEALKNKPNGFKVGLTCGKWLCAFEQRDDGKKILPLFVRSLIGAAGGGLDFVLSYNDIHILDQICFGYLQSIIIDSKTIYVEQPHGLPKLGKEYGGREWICVENNEDFVTDVVELLDTYRRAVRFDDLTLSETAEVMSEYIYPLDEFYRVVKGLQFESRDEFIKLYRRMVG